MVNQDKKIIIIGGGTGTFVVLSGLKRYFRNLTAIVSMADSGGSNKVIRDELGLLPTSDIRQCFVALASGSNETERIMRKLFTYRFNKGNGLKGMTFGNLFMAALAEIIGSQYEAIKKTGEVLRINGKVIPVTLKQADLVAKYEDGEIIKGEHDIDEPPVKHDGCKKIIDLWLEPDCVATDEAIEEIGLADMIVLGPGDLFTSILPNIVVKGLAGAVKKSSAEIVYILNLMTKKGQTFGFSGQDHVNQIKRYLGRMPDTVVVNNKEIPAPVQKHYWEVDQSAPVFDDLKGSKVFKIVRADILSGNIYKSAPSDVLKRSLVRHDSKKLAKVLSNLLQ